MQDIPSFLAIYDRLINKGNIVIKRKKTEERNHLAPTVIYMSNSIDIFIC
jgi:hypothetical protein